MRRAVVTAAIVFAAACGTRLFPIPCAIAEEDDPSKEKFAGEYREKQYKAGLKRKPPAKPADPWAAIDGDQPRKVTTRHLYFENKDPNDCSAAHDHCLPDWAWIAESEGDAKDSPTDRIGRVVRMIDDEDLFDTHIQDPIAYRTVPATKKNLAKGNLVAVLQYPAKAPKSEDDAIGRWRIGFVQSIDWEAGKLRLVGREEPAWLSATRVLVLSWKPGGKVTIMGKRSRDELAVDVKDVILPTSDAGTIAGPWSVVGKDGLPISTTDKNKLESQSAVPCDSAHDHCLRPWAWFTADGLEHVVVMFRDGKLHYIIDVDDTRPVERAQMAYRTVPATVDNIKEGSLVYFRWGTIGSEHDAMTNEWMSGKVTEVQPEAGIFLVEGDKRYYEIGRARVAVVQWFPGEKAEAVP